MSASTPWVCISCLCRISRPRLRIARQIRQAASSAATAAGSSTTPAAHSTYNEQVKISPVLLARARVTAKEHSQLSAKIANSFDQTSAKRVGELTPVTNALSTYDSASDSLQELTSLLRDPSSDEELRNLAAEDLVPATEALDQARQLLAAALIPKHPFDHLPCLMEIRPGVGGNEAGLFAGDLVRMYRAYCTSAGLHASVLKLDAADGMSDAQGSNAPVAEAILEISDAGAYGRLRCEAGIHRVQRVPATESKGRTHTSVASVLVMPSFAEAGANAEDDLGGEFDIPASDVRIEAMRASGAGGQHVNMTDSAVRITHVPTGIAIFMQESRSQHKNRAKAWQVLRARLAQKKREEREEEMLALRRSVPGGTGKTGRNDKIRTYNWGQKRVTDHRSGITLNGALDDVLEGGSKLEDVMESVRGWMNDREIEMMVAEEEGRA